MKIVYLTKEQRMLIGLHYYTLTGNTVVVQNAFRAGFLHRNSDNITIVRNFAKYSNERTNLNMNFA